MNISPAEELYFQLKPYMYDRDGESQKRYNVNEVHVLAMNFEGDKGKKII